MESLAHACGALEATALGIGKPAAYESTYLSTDTARDDYQCVDDFGTKVGKPVSYFVADQEAL